LAESAAKKRLSDAQIKQLLIDESIAAYDGNCPCPYSRARNGSRCGKRSAYSREGGAAPLCYPADVTAAMVQAYRDEHSTSSPYESTVPHRPSSPSPRNHKSSWARATKNENAKLASADTAFAFVRFDLRASALDY
jgi:hypothetical protein